MDEDPSFPELADDQVQETYLSESLAEYGITTWVRQEEVRVYDESANDVAFVEPANGWFLGVDVAIYNASGTPLDERETADFSAYVEGTEYDPIDDLPSDDYTFDDIREYFGYHIDPDEPLFPGDFHPDTTGYVPAVFDVGTDPTEWAINVTGALETEPDQDQYVYYSE